MNALPLAAVLFATAAAAAPAAKPKLAAPGLDGLNLEPRALSFFADHLAAQFSFEGIEVTTPAQIASVLGLERQKQLLGCSDDSACMTEIGNALGVDGILIGSIAKVENLYQLNLRIVSPEDAASLVTYSRRASGTDKTLLVELDSAAVTMARLFKEKLAARRAQAGPSTSSAASGSAVTPVTTPPPAGQTPPAAPPPEAPPRKKNRLTLGVFRALGGTFPFEYERALGDHFSVAPSFTFTLPFSDLLGGRGTGVGGGLGVRFFPSGASPGGLWLGPEVSSEVESGVRFGTGQSYASWRNTAVLMVGYTNITSKNITGSVGVGGGVHYWVHTLDYSGLLPAITVHLNLGWAF